ncbi:hypothetical protein GCM10025883_16920 [Mobilicoccus caccae]|uniref:Transmembrane protein n=2 Tax=Mobilicoccus caccae TaxID=1859295 RepID=A0ABQ6IR48_9MICO|nr:hypothetical protein [Mobilicoccus caccae]GMA39647.1 hypothetical protein GCM10025883_16920 [Mobilicoccus caccae]
MYALTPARRSAQILGDLTVLLWCAAWIWAATIVHDLVLKLAEPAQRLQVAAGEFTSAMTDAGTSVSRIPLAGDELQGTFGRIAAVGVEADAAGVRFEQTVQHLGLALALVVALAPALGLGVPWLVMRTRFARRASAARRFLDSEADLDLFALRAMSRQPLPKLAAISADPVSAWRRGDTEVVHALAELELRSVGLRPPPVRDRR